MTDPSGVRLGDGAGAPGGRLAPDAEGVPGNGGAADLGQVQFASERRVAILITSLIFVPNIFWAITDRQLAPGGGHLAGLYAVRALLLVAYVAGLAALRRAVSRADVRRAVHSLNLAIIAGVLAVMRLRPADNWFPLRTSILIAALIFVAYPNTLRRQLLQWGLLVGGTMAVMQWYYVGMSSVDRISVLSHLLLAGAVGAAVSSMRNSTERDMAASVARERLAISERRHALAQLRALEGIIPICSHCRRVRTEDGAWKGLEHYVHERTDADFSHGICPACLTEHYPDFDGPATSPATPVAG